jgi:hypothetical protein
LALQALGFLAEDSRRLERFLAETGMRPDALMQQAGAPSTLAALLAHLLADESLLLVFAAASGRKPEEIAAAEAVLTNQP